MKSALLQSFVIGSVVLSGVSAGASNWPGWRGPGSSGVSTDKNFVVNWTTNSNVRWRVELPGPGNSSPIVWGNKVLVSQFVKEENRRNLMCFNRADGKLLWQSGVTYTERESTQQNNPYCAGTPVTDGERVVVSFGSAGLFCYDLGTGKEIWQRDLGKLNHPFGNAVSPVLHGDLCFVNFGPDEKARLVAVNKRTGEQVWEAIPPKPDPSEIPQRGGFGGRGPGGPGGPGGPPGANPPPPGAGPGPGAGADGSPRPAAQAGSQAAPATAAAAAAPASGATSPAPGGPGGPGGGGRGPGGGRGGFGGGGLGGSWSTPIIVKAGAREELVVAFPNRLVGYDPATGKQLWFSKGLGGTIYTTPAWGDGLLLAMSSGMGGASAIAVKPGGEGDVTESQRAWRAERVASRTGSGVIHQGYYYAINERPATVECVDLKTGNTVWSERLTGTGRDSSSWSSITLADGNLYIPNKSGDVFVVKASPKFELLATNSVGEPTNASMAASDGDLFLRTNAGLWCFANAK